MPFWTRRKGNGSGLNCCEDASGRFFKLHSRWVSGRKANGLEELPIALGRCDRGRLGPFVPILPRGFTPKLGDRSILRTTGYIGDKPHIFAGALGQRDEGGLEIDLIQSWGVSGRETPLPCHPPSELASVREGREERAGRARNEKGLYSSLVI
jgi:hypothetical protein